VRAPDNECGDTMKLRAADYHAQAVECLEAAQRALTPETRQAYLDLMKQLIELADQMAQLEHESFE
jgi:hypothetical protein